MKKTPQQVDMQVAPDKIAQAMDEMRRKGYQVKGVTQPKYVPGKGMQVSVECEK